ncbi:HD domain-containing protein 2 [Copidosoma floridanum]|uniref:HD domain-containing protein 2 n=1 Tax=Copidosoma floridanum TaxID=29053 RepID=UPI0006C99EAB|nr:HD domain-containing protein 2 [Copidosoma floridanum]
MNSTSYEDGTKNSVDVNKIIEFMQYIGRLKHIKRTGWVRKNIPDPETISGHMYRMAMLSFLVDPKKNLNKSKLIEMALVHDLAECIVGDITPFCGISPEDKHKMEKEAMNEICKDLGERGKEILNIFVEYEERQSPEARYVKDLDRVDFLMQAFEYEERGNKPGQLQEFFDNCKEKLQDPLLSDVVEEIKCRRKALKLKKTNNNSYVFVSVAVLFITIGAGLLFKLINMFTNGPVLNFNY